MFTINNLYFHYQFLSSWENWGEKGEKQQSLLKAGGGSSGTDEAASQKEQADIICHIYFILFQMRFFIAKLTYHLACTVSKLKQ